MTRIRNVTPTFGFDAFYNAHYLSFSFDDSSYQMLIRYDRADGYSYVLLQHVDGNTFRLRTQEEVNGQRLDIEENESKEAADIWYTEQDYILPVTKHHVAWNLQRQWEALAELGVFELSISLSGFKNLPGPSAELKARMDAATRDAFDRDVSAEVDPTEDA